ncbi:MAG: diguanylate cyclase [Pirellulales bacterium]|nr:diguanylate cyclase [Pirellulales bacterium]
MWYFFIIVVANLLGGFALGCYLGRGFRVSQAPTMTMLPDEDVLDSLAKYADSRGPGQSGAGSRSGAGGIEQSQAAAKPSAPEVNRTPSHAALEEFVHTVDEGRWQLHAAHKRFLAAVEGHDAGLIEVCLAAMIDEVRQVADGFAAALATFEPALLDDEALQSPYKRIAHAIDRQSKVVKDAVVTFAAFDPQRLDLSIQESAAKFDDLLAASDGIRDRLAEVAVALAEVEGTFEAMAVDHGEDPTTGLPTGLALAMRLRDWWKKDPQRVRRLTLGAVDVDELGKLNRRFGCEAGDCFLSRLAGLILEEAAERASVCRVGGTRLVLCGMDEDADRVGPLVEKIRQTLDSAEVVHGGEKANATASCAVTDAVPEDTCETLLGRLDEAVRAAKRTGRNRTFLHDGAKPTPVVPPNVATSPRTIDLNES